MRRAYPTSFCFQEAIEIILQAFFHSFNRKGAAPNAKRLQNGVATGCRFEFFAGSNGLKRKVEPALAAQLSRGAESAP
jgi:hypothetical protein